MNTYTKEKSISYKTKRKMCLSKVRHNILSIVILCSRLLAADSH